MTKQTDGSSVLIVEDDVPLNEAYTMILESAGYKVSSVFNGQEALEHLEENGDPNLIYLDLRMPVLDGIGFLKEYDAPSHQDTKIIVFSNYDGEAEVEEAFSLGAQRYVLKARAAPKELLKITEDSLET